MLEINKLVSYLNHSLEHDSVIFNHRYHEAHFLGQKFTHIEDDPFLKSLPKKILKVVPDKSFSIGSTIYHTKPELLSYSINFGPVEILLYAVIRYTTKEHSWHHGEHIHIDSIPGLRAWLHKTHNDAHVEHGLEPRWDIIEEEEKTNASTS